MTVVKLDVLATSVKEMNVTDSLVSGQAESKRITRTRYHYKPISSAELLLTVILSTFIGVGLFIAAGINTQPEDADSQIQLSSIEQHFNLVDNNLFANL